VPIRGIVGDKHPLHRIRAPCPRYRRRPPGRHPFARPRMPRAHPAGM